MAIRWPAYLAPGLVLAVGLYFMLTHGWRYVIDARLFFGHGYILYSFTAVFFGAYGLLAARRWGSKGLLVWVATAISCDIAQTFLSVYPGSPFWLDFTQNYGVEPVFWAVVLYLCWRFSRMSIKPFNPWVVGMLVFWLALVQVGVFVPTAAQFFEPSTELTWMLAAWKSVSVDA